MGEVYSARDTRLNRIAAIKILPPAFSADEERLLRFQREARSASALNHPNIVTIYELGQEGPTRYIAMELVEGRTLRDLLSAGMLPVQKVVEIAAQAAEGLAKAHEAGIAHRDLKPENLMLSRDGFVKILDFGLSKAAPADGEGDMNTQSAWQTRPGVRLGTTAYMSPEQASGAPADFRSDQFSLGLVLYEMLAGRRPFERPTGAETTLAILREQAPPLGAQNPDAPAPLCWAIERCLAKEPEKRYVSTRDLARELTAIRERLAQKPAPAPAVERAQCKTNLPAQRTAFVGREREIAAARELLLSKDVRLVTVTGPGGIGKTRLAMEVAGGLSGEFPGGVHFVALSALNDVGLVPSAIVQTLGIREAGAQSPLDTLKRSLQDSQHAPVLLVLDNFEHLMAAAPAVSDLLAAAPGLKILATSRAALHMYGEQEFPVPALDVPDVKAAQTVSAVSRCTSVALFMQRAAAAKPGFELNPQNASAIAEVCARLDGLPLAIELAAARVKVLSPADMRTRLTNRLQLLTGGARDLPQRQQTLRAAIDWSYDLLTEAEQKLFRRLSVFVGGSTLEGVEAVCDTSGDLELDLLDSMASLVDKSLMRQTELCTGESRFTMLETIREYASEKLQASEESAAVRRAHAAYCLVLGEEDASGQSGGNAAWLERMATEHDNVRAAFDWLEESGDAEWGLRLGAAQFRFWETREFFAEGRERLSRLLKMPGAQAPTRARVRVLFAAGVLARAQGDYAPADALFAESLEEARKLGDKQAIAVSLNGLAVHLRDKGDPAAARSLFEESLALWRELGDQSAAALALSNLANVVKLEGDYPRARTLYAECRVIFNGLGDRTRFAWALNHEGDAAREQGDLPGAQGLFEQALEIFRQMGDGWGIAGTLADLGNVARDTGECSRARALYRESLKMFQGMEHKRGVARLLECFASAAAAQQQAERSLRLAGAAAALRREIGAPLAAGEQARLDWLLAPARRAMAHVSGATAWLDGWSMPVDEAMAEVLKLDTAPTAS